MKKTVLRNYAKLLACAGLNIRRGDEATVSLSGLAPGVYVIKINTTANSTTRKVVVK